MVVNGFELPAAFVELCDAIDRGEAPTDWVLKENVDAYGRPWDVADLRIMCDPAEIQSDTDWMIDAFLHKGKLQGLPRDTERPGSITDFVRFAHSTDGLTYAFDFGTNANEPSVVHWDGEWYRVAPNFATLMTLFIDGDEAWLARMAEEDEEDEEECEYPPPSLRSLFAVGVLEYVFSLSAEERPASLANLCNSYAQLTPQERQEVEAQAQEWLKDEGMTDERRRRLDEVWERLRATVPP